VVPPFPVNNQVDGWQKSAQPAWFDPSQTGGVTWDQLSGVFANTAPTSSDHIDNMAGSQAAYMFSLPQVAFFQDFNSTDWNHSTPTHAFNPVFEIGKSYELTVGLIGGGGTMSVGTILELGLYYRDGANNMVNVAANDVTFTPSLFPTTTHFIDFQVNVPTVQATDPWAGKNIGIDLLSLYGQGDGYWDLDNVRLTAVPEPTSFALVGFGLAGLALASRGRKNP